MVSAKAKGRGRRARFRRRLARWARSRRGAALIIALVFTALLSAFSVEFVYNMRVSAHLSNNLKWELQAYYNARSAMEIARAVIATQKKFQTMLSAVSGGKKANLELWRYACKFAQIFATGDVEFLGRNLFSLRDFEGVGIASGSFECEIVPEDGKVNVSRATNATEKTALFRKLYAILRRYFGVESIEQRDREAVELVLNIIDWVDMDEARSDIDDKGNVVDTSGGAGEGGNYRRYGYEARNAKPDSNEEIRLIEGMTDEIYCDVGTKMTVYDTQKVNVNTADIEVVKALICEYVTGDMMQACGTTGMGTGAGALGIAVGYATPVDYVGQLIETCRQIKGMLMVPAFPNPQAFTGLFAKLPAPLNSMIQVNARQMQAEVGIEARVLRIRSVGQAGPIHKQLEAVIDTSAAGYVYWREY